MNLKLSILDQSPVSGDETAAVAFEHTIELAGKAEQWGYHRFWVAEHHGSDRVMGSSPEVLVSHLLAKTARIRVGAGGVMLQHYSPYKVAENFNVLASLAPGRVDLGIGGGPGGMPRSTMALRPEAGVDTPSGSDFEAKLRDLSQILGGRLAETHPLHGLRASPTPPQPADLYLLGTTPSSARLAAKLGMPYVFALFLNSDDAAMDEAVRTYRGCFDAAEHRSPRVMLALPVIVADDGAEARRHASQVQVIRVRLESGRTFTVFSEDAAREFGRQSNEKFSYETQESNVIHGSPETVRARLSELQERYRLDEIFAVTAVDDFQKRLRSYELLSGLFRG